MKQSEIIKAVQHHHDLVRAKGYDVIMTALVGSQNYGLNHEGSDIDTYSLTVPSWDDFLHNKDRKAGLIVAEDGHCNFKDFWVALNLLEKTSPNSVEYFTSKYIVFDPRYRAVLRSFLDDPEKMYAMIHCNHGHMIMAIAGMAHQLEVRNMAPGKSYSHALRLESMIYRFMSYDKADKILDFMDDTVRQEALKAKLDKDPDNEKFYLQECHSIADYLKACEIVYRPLQAEEELEAVGKKTIEDLRHQVGKIYLKEVCKENEV